HPPPTFPPNLNLCSSLPDPPNTNSESTSSEDGLNATGLLGSTGQLLIVGTTSPL
ncbi:hypothetical protein L9F63_015705, partial [Diploptera punctata]